MQYKLQGMAVDDIPNNQSASLDDRTSRTAMTQYEKTYLNIFHSAVIGSRTLV